jgi:two-component system sensor histidine kinase KdpD
MIARMRLVASRAEMETVSKMAQLRTALLSSLSHDFRTPLSAILASASSLVDYGDQFSPEVRRDLLSNIQHEAEALSRFVSNLLSITRLESGVIALEPAPTQLADLVNEVADRIERRGDKRRIRVIERVPGANVMADPLLLGHALANVLDNALRYSGEDPPVEAVIERGPGGALQLVISDHGPGVRAEDRGRIFEKFFRVQDGRGRDGSGLGLSIAKGLIEAMNGSIVAADRPSGAGLAITIILPELSFELAA